MLNISNTLNELKTIVNQIKTKQDSHTAWTGTEKVDFEKRLAHLYDKSNPRHTNLTADLDFDLKDLENIDKTIGQQKLTTDAEIKKLTEKKTQLEKDIQAKDALIKQKNEEIGDKLTADLITKLDNLTKGVDENGKVKIDETTLTTIKTVVEEIKTKGAKVDLAETNRKVDEVKTKLETVKPESKGTDYWSIAACAGGIISLLLLTYLAFFKPNKSSSSRIKSEVEE